MLRHVRRAVVDQYLADVRRQRPAVAIGLSLQSGAQSASKADLHPLIACRLRFWASGSHGADLSADGDSPQRTAYADSTLSAQIRISAS
jgi:hypothetical protein